MSEPSLSDMRLYERALRHGWDIPAKTRTAIIGMLTKLVRKKDARPRERTAAARVLLQASRVHLDAIRLQQVLDYEDLVQRLQALEGKDHAELADAVGGD
jgi:hypothetical protein